MPILGLGRRNGLPGRTKKPARGSRRQYPDDLRLPLRNGCAAFPPERKPKSGHLMCYQNRTTSKATDTVKARVKSRLVRWKFALGSRCLRLILACAEARNAPSWAVK